MGATAEVTLSATASGLPEGGLTGISYSMSNTSAANTVSILNLTTLVTNAVSVIMPSSAQFILAIPPSTNPNAWFVTPSTAQNGIPVSSNGMVFMRVAGGSTFFFYAAAGGSTFPLRVITY